MAHKPALGLSQAHKAPGRYRVGAALGSLCGTSGARWKGHRSSLVQPTGDDPNSSPDRRSDDGQERWRHHTGKRFLHLFGAPWHAPPPAPHAPTRPARGTAPVRYPTVSPPTNHLTSSPSIHRAGVRRELQGAQAFAEATAAAVEAAAVREAVVRVAAVREAAVREGKAAAAAAPPSPTHPGAASSSPRLPKPRDAGAATTPRLSGLAPLERLANDVPVVHVVEGPGGVPLEIRVHLPNGFPGQMPSGYDSRPPPTTPAPSPPGLFWT